MDDDMLSMLMGSGMEEEGFYADAEYDMLRGGWSMWTRMWRVEWARILTNWLGSVCNMAPWTMAQKKTRNKCTVSA